MIKVAVYGTLREGQHHYIACGSPNVVVSKKTISGFKMYDIMGIPACCKASPNHKIIIDVIELTPEYSTEIDIMEINAGYYIDTIMCSGEPVKIYLWEEKYLKNKRRIEIVTNGDWILHKNKKYAIS